MQNQAIEQFHEDGFVVLENSSQKDLSQLQQFIFEKMRCAIRSHDTSVDELFEISSLERYHNFPFSVNHEAYWTKDARIFNASDVDFFINDLGFIDIIQMYFGDIEIADIEGLGHPEMYWRVVRPGGSDVAPAHKDSWFWELTNNIPMPSQKSLAKVWIPILSVVGENALQVAPGSHKVDIQYRGVNRHGRLKPEPDKEALRKINFIAPEIPNGSMIIFDRDLLHRGASNSLDKTRYSLEFAIRSKCGRFQ
jgi:hypothetical protein